MTIRDSQAPSSLSPELQQQLLEEQVGALVMTARRALRRGNKTEARNELKKALQLNVDDCGALELLGEYYMSEGEQEKALEVLERGHKLYPHHSAFEKNIALCVLDLEEMRRERELPTTLEDPDQWMDRKPFISAFLSILPGAGQAYNGDTENAIILFCAWLLASLGWYFPLMSAFKNLPRDSVHSFAAALASTSSAGRIWFWLAMAVWIGLYVYAFVDAIIGAARANKRRQNEEF